MDWWVVQTFLKTEFSLLSTAAEFTRTRLLLALFPRRLWGNTRYILCLMAEVDAAEPPWKPPLCARFLTPVGR